MKTHKLQINTLNAITIGLIIRLTTLMLSLLLLLLFLFYLLLCENILTEKCNKLNGNPHRCVANAMNGHCCWPTNCTQAAEISGKNDTENDTSNIDRSDGEEQLVGRWANRSGESLTRGRYDLNASIRRNQYKESEKRTKRFILFNGNGVVKLALVASFPITLVDRQRSLSFFYNFHLQYIPPPRPIYWWSIFNSSTFAARQLSWTSVAAKSQSVAVAPPPPLKQDKSRQFFYSAIEGILEREGLPGVACLLRAICDVAQRPFHVHESNSNGAVFHALLNAILTLFIQSTFMPVRQVFLVQIARKRLVSVQRGVYGWNEFHIISEILKANEL